MAKDASLFTWLDEDKERKIYVSNGFSLDVIGEGDDTCQHVKVFDVYHVPNLNSNLWCVSQLTQTRNIVEFWPIISMFVI